MPKLYAGFKPVLNKTILLFHFFAFFFFSLWFKKKKKNQAFEILKCWKKGSSKGWRAQSWQD